MSSINKERIKGFKIKENSNLYSSLIPFGTEGQLTDMSSSLDLEEQLKIGGNHYIEIQEEDNDEVEVREWYCTQPVATEEEKIEFCSYTVITNFTEGPVSTAIDVTQDNNDGTDLLIDQDSENSNLIVLKEDENIRTTITTSLYKGYYSGEGEGGVLLHSKTIILNPPNQEQIESISEEVEII